MSSSSNSSWSEEDEDGEISEEDEDGEIFFQITPSGNCLVLPEASHDHGGTLRILETINKRDFNLFCARNAAISEENSLDILTALSSKANISQINLSGCGLSDEALAVLMEIDLTTLTLTSVYAITDQGYNIIFNRLGRRECSLEVLQISDVGDPHIAEEGIRWNGSLESFHFEVDDIRIPLKFEATMAILRGVKDNVKMQQIEMIATNWEEIWETSDSYPRVDQQQQQKEMFDLLVEIVEDNSILRVLSLDGYHPSPAQKEKLLAAQWRNPRRHPIAFCSKMDFGLYEDWELRDPMCLHPSMTNEEQVMEMLAWWRSKLVAFAMSEHPRLGGGSLGRDVMKMIINAFYFDK
jgi:hypothetical protein